MGGGGGGYCADLGILKDAPPSIFSPLIAQSVFALIRTDRESLARANNLYRSRDWKQSGYITVYHQLMAN